MLIMGGFLVEEKQMGCDGSFLVAAASFSESVLLMASIPPRWQSTQQKTTLPPQLSSKPSSQSTLVRCVVYTRLPLGDNKAAIETDY